MIWNEQMEICDEASAIINALSKLTPADVLLIAIRHDVHSRDVFGILEREGIIKRGTWQRVAHRWDEQELRAKVLQI